MGKREKPEFRHVYFIEAVGLDLVKIGHASDARTRLRDLQVGSPVQLVLKGVYHVDDAARMEGKYHNQFAHLRQHGEWFRIDDELRRLIDDAFQPDENKFLICLNPRPPSGVAIFRELGETDDAFARRACFIGNAAIEAANWDDPHFRVESIA